MRHEPTLDAANEVVEEARSIRKLDGRSARKLLTAWMRAMGWPSDRYDNWFPGPGRGYRYHFSKRMFQYQRKLSGDWRNVESVSLLDAATKVILVSGAKAGRQKEVERFVKKAKTRKKARTRAAQRRRDVCSLSGPPWLRQAQTAGVGDAYQQPRRWRLGRNRPENGRGFKGSEVAAGEGTEVLLCFVLYQSYHGTAPVWHPVGPLPVVLASAQAQAGGFRWMTK